MPSSKPKVTIVEVAAAAGVSVSAVSRAFSPAASCSEKMRAKVLAAAEQLGYQPNRLARGLKSRSSLIGILLTDFDNPWYLPILKHFSELIQARNCHCLLVNTDGEQGLQESLELVMQYRVDGLIVTSASLPETLAKACRDQQTPVVCFSRSSASPYASAVYCDNIASGQMAADLFLDAGYLRPAFVSGPLGASATLERQRGFIGRLVERGCHSWQLAEGGQYSYDAGFEAACQLLKASEPPDALFFADDIMACGGMDAARYEFGLAVPEQIGVIGVDDIRLASSRAYQLTTIRQPLEQMVDTTVELLFQQIDNPGSAAEQRVLPNEMVERQSTRNRS